MIIGRKRQQELLERAYKAKKNQFITIYGRRRVGKTYLITEFFKSKKCHFLHVTGLQHGSQKEQLENFIEQVSKTFYAGISLQTPATWKDVFKLLTQQIEKSNEKVVLFFDELPWMVTHKSKLLNTIDYFWNNQWFSMRNVIFIACGSSASWIMKNIIYNTGGLHNRTNLEINLQPFNLCETKEYLKSLKVTLNDSHILSLYMAIGGIPYYLDYVMRGETAQQNIQNLFFDHNAPLKSEYNKLFESLFNGADVYKEIIEAVAKKREGISITELGSMTKQSTVGGLLAERLQKLCDSGFIEKYVPWKKQRGAYYKVIDEFCLFYLYWIKNAPSQKFDPDHWIIESQQPRYHAWSGYAFEAVCAKHSHQIIRGLGITNAKIITSWRYIPKERKERGAQIDLVIVRGDNAITVCEIKYTDKPFAIDKSYAQMLAYKITAFKKHTKTDKQIFLAMVSAKGLKNTIYSEEMVSGIVTTADLFKCYGIT